MKKQGFLLEFQRYLSKIQDEKLRFAVQAVWENLFNKSEWNSIYDIPSGINCTAISLVKHTCNVTEYAVNLAEVYGKGYKELDIDRDCLIAGCLLHDVAKILEYHPVVGGVQKTEEGRLYADQFFGINEAFRQEIPVEVIHMIISNSEKTGRIPTTPEALILYFCERIDEDICSKMAGLPLRAKDKNYLITHTK